MTLSNVPNSIMIQNTDQVEPKFVENTIQSNVSLAPISRDVAMCKSIDSCY